MAAGNRAPEIGHDPIGTVGPPPPWTQWFPARHAALGLRPSALPLVGFVLIGVVLGPSGLGVLSTDALAHLDIAISVGLAALGVFIGLGIGAMRRADVARVGVAALVQSFVTIAVVAAGLSILLARWSVPLPIDALLLAAGLAVCASASAATRSEDASPQARAASQLVDLDDVPLVVVGTTLVSSAAGQPLGTTLAVTAVASLLTGLAGWLLFERAGTDAERGVFVTGAVLLLGGVAAFADASPLASGVVAALVWVRARGAADRIITSDLRKLQHPLVALLLILAGALVEWSLPLLWIASPLVLLRLVGKLLAGVAAARLMRVPAGLLATVLLPPGVLGVALALNLWQVLGARGTLLLSAATVAAVAAELLSALLPAEPEAR